MWQLTFAVTAAIVALLAFRLPTIVDLLDLQKKIVVTGNAAQCEVHGGFKTDGFEDVVYVNATVAVACAGGLGTVFHDAELGKVLAQKSNGSACVLLQWDDASRTVSERLMAIEGVPYFGDNSLDGNKILFHVHGMHVITTNQGPVLAAINHGYDHGGDGVLFFAVDVPHSTLRFLHHAKLTGDALETYRGTLNEVAVQALTFSSTGQLLGGTILLSNYIEFADVAPGVKHWPKPLLLAATYARSLIGVFNTKLLKCRFATLDGDTELKCAAVASGFGMANGIIVADVPNTPAAQVVVVGDVILHEMRVFLSVHGSTPEDGREGMIAVHYEHALDNIELDPTDGIVCHNNNEECVLHFYGGLVASLITASVIDNHGNENLRSPGGLSEFFLAVSLRDNQELVSARLHKANVLVLHNGTFAGTSAGVVLGDRIVLGSYKKQGLLFCPLLKQ